MSDNKIRYSAIRKALNDLYPSNPEGNVARRLNTLAAMISGIVGSGSCQLPKIAAKVPDEGAKTESVEARIKRQIKNEKFEWEIYFLPFAHMLLLSLGLAEIVLAMDGSTAGRGCMTLMVSVIYKKRALPVAYTVIQGKKGHFPEKKHIELLEQVRDMIPESVQRIVFLGDGEFDGTDLQKTLNGWGWLYVCRTAENIKIFFGEDDDGGLEISTAGFFLPEECYRRIRSVLFTNKKYGPVTVVVWRGEKNKDPLYLVTNMKSGKKACDYYSRRFRIETFFSDQKSRGFNIHKSHLSDPDRLCRLMIAACLAYIWIVFLGTLAVKQGWNKIIHRTDRCDLSLFQMGLKLLNHFLDYDIHIPAAFEIFNPTL